MDNSKKILNLDSDPLFKGLVGLSNANAAHHDDHHSEHDDHHHEGPYDYTERDPFYYWAHNDAWVHPYKEDPYCNAPKGYITYDDPLDERTVQSQVFYPAASWAPPGRE